MSEPTATIDSFAAYAEAAAQTAIYPREFAGVYPAMRYASEVGELRTVTALIYDESGRPAALDELGDGDRR